MSKPKWDVTDIRGLVVLAMVAVLFYILHLVATHPELADNDLFQGICNNLTGVGGFGLVLMFLFGGSKASTEAATTVNDIARNPTVIAPADPKPVVVEAPAVVTVSPAPGEPKA